MLALEFNVIHSPPCCRFAHPLVSFAVFSSPLSLVQSLVFSFTSKLNHCYTATNQTFAAVFVCCGDSHGEGRGGMFALLQHQHITLHQLNRLSIIKTTEPITGKHTLARARVYLILVYLWYHPNTAQQTNEHECVKRSHSRINSVRSL